MQSVISPQRLRTRQLLGNFSLYTCLAQATAFAAMVFCPCVGAPAAVLCRHECKQLGDFTYVVTNREGQLEECVDKLCAIIDAERHRVHGSSQDKQQQQQPSQHQQQPSAQQQGL